MDMLKRFATFSGNLCIIAMLIWGDENMQTFGLFISAIMTVIAWIALFSMKAQSAKEIHATLGRRVIGVLLNIGYTYALIVSGSPVWAALHILGFSAVRMNAAKMVNEAKE